MIVSGLARLSRCRLPESLQLSQVLHKHLNVRKSRSAAVFILDFPPLEDFNGRKRSRMKPQLGPVQPGKAWKYSRTLNLHVHTASVEEFPPSVILLSHSHHHQRGLAEGSGPVGEGGGGGAIPASVICLWWVSVEWDSLPCNDPSTS